MLCPLIDCAPNGVIVYLACLMMTIMVVVTTITIYIYIYIYVCIYIYKYVYMYIYIYDADGDCGDGDSALFFDLVFFARGWVGPRRWGLGWS